MFQRVCVQIGIPLLILIAAFLVWIISRKKGSQISQTHNDQKELKKKQNLYSRISGTVFLISFAAILFGGEYSRYVLIFGIVGVIISEIVRYFALKRFSSK